MYIDSCVEDDEVNGRFCMSLSISSLDYLQVVRYPSTVRECHCVGVTGVMKHL